MSFRGLQIRPADRWRNKRTVAGSSQSQKPLQTTESPRKLTPPSRNKRRRWSVVRAMEKMREVVQQATSSSSATSGHGRALLQTLPRLIEAADLFVSRIRETWLPYGFLEGRTRILDHYILIGAGLSREPRYDSICRLSVCESAGETLDFPFPGAGNCARS